MYTIFNNYTNLLWVSSKRFNKSLKFTVLTFSVTCLINDSFIFQKVKKRTRHRSNINIRNTYIHDELTYYNLPNCNFRLIIKKNEEKNKIKPQPSPQQQKKIVKNPKELSNLYQSALFTRNWCWLWVPVAWNYAALSCY